MRNLTVLCAVLVTLVLARGQDIKVTTQSAPVDILTINDVDFLKSTTPKWLFTIVMMLNPPTGTADVTMTIEGNILLSTGESFPQAVYYTSKRFAISPTRTLTNLDLPSLKMSYNFSEVAKSRLEEIALPSGKLPAGTYTFNVTVTRVAGGNPYYAEHPITFVLTNPSAVELLFPFDGDMAVSQFPLFQWLYDGTSTTLTIYERLPGQASNEETASGTPLLSQDVTGNFFQYPGSGVRSLQPGKTYVWTVLGRVRTTGGSNQPIRSPLRSFTVAASGGLSSGASYLAELERALDPKYKPIFDQIRDEGLLPSGVLRLNGSLITSEDLLRIINQIRASSASVQSLRIE
jgi:hypothetical protein